MRLRPVSTVKRELSAAKSLFRLSSAISFCLSKSLISYPFTTIETDISETFVSETHISKLVCILLYFDTAVNGKSRVTKSPLAPTIGVCPQSHKFDYYRKQPKTSNYLRYNRGLSPNVFPWASASSISGSGAVGEPLNTRAASRQPPRHFAALPQPSHIFGR